jgi:uncharacterized protein Usg
MRLEVSDFALMLREWRLTTAEILYHMPDHPAVLQTFVWQYMDMPPRFPRLLEFLDFWTRDIDGPLHSVNVMHEALTRPARYRYVDKVLRLQ